MDEEECLARLRLIRSENVGPITFRQLMRRFGSARAAVAALPDLAKQAGRQSYRVATIAEAEAELRAVEAVGARTLHVGVAPYPTRLDQIEDAPPVLISRGDLRWLDRPALAIVGARNASAAGMRLAREWSAELAAGGITIVSGLARGIDAAAHRGSLPGTIACVAGGADVAYPPELADLMERITSEGLVLAEQRLGAEPQARHFPRRNRIISGLSIGVVVVEAALRSGSLITARYAGEQGREVMAVPGSPLDPRSHGANSLIREGATLVQSAADILEAIAPGSAGGTATHMPAQVAEPEAAFVFSAQDLENIAALLGPAPVSITELAAAAELPVAAVQAAIVDLELAGRAARHAGGRVACA